MTREAIMISIHENFKRHSWTIYNLDHLHLIKKTYQNYCEGHWRRSSKSTIIQWERRRTTSRSTNVSSWIDEKDLHSCGYQWKWSKQQSVSRTKSIGQTTERISCRRFVIRIDFNRNKKNNNNFHLGALERLDRIAMEFQHRLGETYRQLADRLIAACQISPDRKSDIVPAIVVWITNHIRYDVCDWLYQTNKILYKWHSWCWHQSEIIRPCMSNSLFE